MVYYPILGVFDRFSLCPGGPTLPGSGAAALRGSRARPGAGEAVCSLLGEVPRETQPGFLTGDPAGSLWFALVWFCFGAVTGLAGQASFAAVLSEAQGQCVLLPSPAKPKLDVHTFLLLSLNIKSNPASSEPQPGHPKAPVSVQAS